MAWLNSQERPAGNRRSANLCASLTVTPVPATQRARMRATLVSTGATSSSNAKAWTARAVYGPTPASARQGSLVLGELTSVLLRDRHGRPVQVECAAVVTQSRPEAHDVARPGSGAVPRRGECREKRLVVPDDTVNLCLLEHHFTDQDAPRITRGPPWQVTSMCGSPFEHSALEPPDPCGREGLSPRRCRRTDGGASARAPSSTP